MILAKRKRWPDQKFLSAVVIIFLIGWQMLIAAPAAPLKDGEHPNIVFILADDLGAHDVRCFGSTYYETPNIDRLTTRGVRFTQAYSASPLCSPTRASIMTGLDPARIGITAPSCHLPQVQLDKKLGGKNPTFTVMNAESITRLKPEYYTLPEALSEASYKCAHFGKWHLGFNRPGQRDDHYEPKDQGFTFDFPHTPQAAGPGSGYLAPWKFIGDPNVQAAKGTHIEDRMSEEAAKYIHANKDQPFFLNYWAYSVHSPWNAKQEYIDHFQAKTDGKNPQHNPLYAAMVKSLDDAVGSIVTAIDEAGIADRTIIVFTSDNGGWAYPPRSTDPEGFGDIPATSNAPLRSGKASIYEGGTRVPCAVVWPGKTKPDSTSESFIQSTDWYPTLLTMAGLKPNSGVKFDGIDQTPAILGQAPARDLVFCHFPHGSVGQTKNIPGFLPSAYVRKGDYKLIRFFAANPDGSDGLELYDLKNDIGESTNLASTKVELAEELSGLLSKFLKETDAVIPIRNPNYDPNAVPKSAGNKKTGHDK